MARREPVVGEQWWFKQGETFVVKVIGVGEDDVVTYLDASHVSYTTDVGTFLHCYQSYKPAGPKPELRQVPA